MICRPPRNLINHQLEAQVKSMDEKLATEKASISDLKAKLSNVDSRRKAIEERGRVFKTEVKATRIAIDKVIKEYKNSQDFKDEVAEACVESLHLVFLECKKKVTTFFLELDLKGVVKSNNEGDEEKGGEGVEEGVEVRAKLVGIEGTVTRVVIDEIAAVEEEISMEEVIIEAIAYTKAMAAKVIEDSEAA